MKCSCLSCQKTRAISARLKTKETEMPKDYIAKLLQCVLSLLQYSQGTGTGWTRIKVREAGEQGTGSRRF